MSIYTEEELAERKRNYDEMMKNAPKVNDVVLVTDEQGVEHNGLVTAVHGPHCINVVYVSGDALKNDPYGRQLERMSSLSEKSEHTAPRGRFYVRT